MRTGETDTGAMAMLVQRVCTLVLCTRTKQAHAGSLAGTRHIVNRQSINVITILLLQTRLRVLRSVVVYRTDAARVESACGYGFWRATTALRGCGPLWSINDLMARLEKLGRGQII